MTTSRSEPAGADRARVVLLVTCAALTIARAAAALLPGSSAWGFDALRSTPPWAAWPLWALGALALVPGIARAAAPALASAGDAIARAPRAAPALFAAAVALLVLLLPDRLWLMGDFLLRLGCTRGEAPLAMVFPQAMPLDLLLHHHIPVALYQSQGFSPNLWERLLGACEAAALAAFAAAFARDLGLRGPAAAACAGSLALTGLLGMFTGYGKAFVEMTLLTVASGVLALRLARTGSGAWPLSGIAVTAMLLHRWAWPVLAPIAAAGVLWWRGPAREPGAKRASTLVALAVPIAAAAILAPRIFSIIRSTDRQHVAPTGTAPAAILSAALAPAHLADLVNLIAQSTPLLFAVPVLALVRAGGAGVRPAAPNARRGDSWVLAALAVPAAAALLLVHPGQGAFRDGDVLAPSLAALALVTAALLGHALAGRSKLAWVAVPVVLATLVPAVQLLAGRADVDRGLARVEHYLAGPPERRDDPAALLWTYIGERDLGLGRKDAAADAYAHAAGIMPSARMLLEWAMAEEDRGNWTGSREAFRRLVILRPNFTAAWLGYARNSARLGERSLAQRAVARALVLEPGSADAQAMARALAPAPATPDAAH